MVTRSVCLEPMSHDDAGTVVDTEMMVAMAIHELRGPIQSLMGFLRLMLEGKLGPVNGPQAAYLAATLDIVSRIARRFEELDSELTLARS